MNSRFIKTNASLLSNCPKLNDFNQQISRAFTVSATWRSFRFSREINFLRIHKLKRRKLHILVNQGLQDRSPSSTVCLLGLLKVVVVSPYDSGGFNSLHVIPFSNFLSTNTLTCIHTAYTVKHVLSVHSL